MKGKMSTLKRLLFFFNLLCAICGIILIVCGTILFSKVYSVDEFNAAIQTQQIPVALIVIGTLLLANTFLGGCGAIKESFCMSLIYSIVLYLLIIVEIAFMIYLFVAKYQTLKTMEETVERAWDRRLQKPNHVDALQTEFSCCGRSDYRDYIFQGSFPTSCCVSGNCDVEDIYLVGCKEAFVDFWDLICSIILYSGQFVVAIEFVSAAFALTAWKRTRTTEGNRRTGTRPRG